MMNSNKVVINEDVSYGSEGRRDWKTGERIYSQDELGVEHEGKFLNAEKAQADAQFTMIISGLNGHGQDYRLQEFNYTDNICLIFDCITDYEVTRDVDKTQFAVEDGVTISDHAVIKDTKISFTARVTTSPQMYRKANYIDRNTDPEAPRESGRMAAALAAVNECIDKRQLVTLVTEEDVYENFIITSMKASRKNAEGEAILFDITLQEFRTFKTKMVEATIFSDPKKSPKKNKGIVNDKSKDSNVARVTYNADGTPQKLNGPDQLIQSNMEPPRK
ncbi:TPA: hypothetical protein RHX51_003861 [Escherichia coli]|nr:hypothetical protein [Escherichia coli]HDV2557638.1 hypothetical protein [Escherichia coli]